MTTRTRRYRSTALTTHVTRICSGLRAQAGERVCTQAATSNWTHRRHGTSTSPCRITTCRAEVTCLTCVPQLRNQRSLGFALCSETVGKPFRVSTLWHGNSQNQNYERGCVQLTLGSRPGARCTKRREEDIARWKLLNCRPSEEAAGAMSDNALTERTKILQSACAECAPYAPIRSRVVQQSRKWRWAVE